MGDLGHPLPPVSNCRKRKADADEEPTSDTPAATDDILVEGIPRQPPSSPWLSTNTARAVWPSDSSSPTDSAPSSPLSPDDDPSLRSSKRPRVDTAPPKTHLRVSDRHPSPRSPTRRSRKRPDSREVVPLPTPQPSVLKIDSQLPPSDSPIQYPAFPNIDLSSPHIPSLHPLINRQTLKELDLAAILRNPQLRHDLLFDAGLQFRPTSGRRKRELSDRYWRAVAQELETGCTCVSFDIQWRPCDPLCVCRRVAIPAQNPILTYSASRRILTLRMPSRLRPLLTEFLEVLLFVIQPLTSISDAYANPSTFQAQIERHAAQAAHLRSVFDPDLIQQELQHDLFDPSGLFIVIGQTLKSHCAPMRDRAVDAMVEVAKTCAPGGGGSKADAVKAVRMCLDILELMKLDIANHQLQTLRPFLIDSSGQYELKAFKGRKGPSSSLEITRKWIMSSHHCLLTSPILSHPSFSSGSFDYRHLSQSQKTYISALKGLADLVFDPPSPAPSPAPACSSGSAVAAPSSMCPLPLYPETTYLDSARLLVLAADAADTAAMYMFLLLYRQLVFSDSGDSSAPRDQSRVNHAELLRLKKEIRDISSSHLGHCFKYGNLDGSDSAVDRDKWCKLKQDIVLQVALRAKEARTSTDINPSALPTHVPDERLLKLAEGWSDTHIRPNSPLSTMLKNRVRDAVFSQVLAFTFPPSDASLGSIRTLGSLSTSSPPCPAGLASGMEPLADEVRSLAERLARLAHIHLGVYLPLYEQEDVLSDASSSTS
ncbi:T-complex protein 11-domain-containing protein [Scleroderma yunnanense]